MKLDDIGRILRTNDVDINPERVRKRYRDFAVTMAWGFLERKPYASARERYFREKCLVQKFYDSGLNTPELLKTDDENLTLRWRTLELTDLVQIFEDPRIHPDDKLQYFREALEVLSYIHNLSESHGDPYLKNMFRLDRDYPKRKRIYTCDFEYERTSSDSQVTDLLILTADAAHLLSHSQNDQLPAAISAVNEVYGRNLSFHFTPLDILFFRMRFGMDSQFFNYFGN